VSSVVSGASGQRRSVAPSTSSCASVNTSSSSAGGGGARDGGVRAAAAASGELRCEELRCEEPRREAEACGEVWRKAGAAWGVVSGVGGGAAQVELDTARRRRWSSCSLPVGRRGSRGEHMHAAVGHRLEQLQLTKELRRPERQIVRDEKGAGLRVVSGVLSCRGVKGGVKGAGLGL
jgi:hypothetical protein